MPKKLTVEDFVREANCIHGDKYNYDSVNYVNMNTKITIFCFDHGEFKQLPSNHLYLSQGCPECGKLRQGPQVTTDEFIQKARDIHGLRYDYSLVNYTHSKKNIVIICNIHGKFLQMPNCHLSGQGCSQCGIEARTNERRKSIDNFISEALLVHGDKYDYTNIVYINNKMPVDIICPSHGLFSQNPLDHLSKGCGCPFCYKSIGEQSVEQSLVDLELDFECQVKFNDCKNIRPLPFDFCVNYQGSEYLIEYDGKQHFSDDDFFGGKDAFRQRQIRDKIKNDFSRRTKRKLIRLRKEHIDRMSDILENLICYGNCWEIDDYVIIV